MNDQTINKAESLDQNDPLSGFRHEFEIPKDQKGNPLVYLCGNSLGLQPKQTKDYIGYELEHWAKWGVDGHTKGHNATSIGICYVGGMDKNKNAKDTRNEAQRAAMDKLIDSLREEYPEATIHGHNEFAAKACPSFDVQKEYGHLNEKPKEAPKAKKATPKKKDDE